MTFTLYFLGIATAAYTTVPQYRYGQWLDPAAFIAIGGLAIPYGTAAVMVSLHWAKVVLVAATVCLWRCQHRAAAAIVGAICLGLAALSIWNSMGLLALKRTERVTALDMVAQRDADLRAELKAIVERLALIGWRPLAAVKAEIAMEQRQYNWESTSRCTQIKTGADRRYCARLDRLEGEGIVALEAERLRSRELELRRALERQPVAMQGRQPDLALLADVLDISPDRAELLRALVYSLLVEAVELALFWVAGILSLRSKSGVRDERDGAANRLDAVKNMSATRVSKERGHLRASAGVLQMATDAPDRTAAVRRTSNKKSTRRRPPIVPCDACPVTQPPHSSPTCVGQGDERRRAVVAFVAQLPRSASARASGSALYAAYDHRRGLEGWPPIPPNAFGSILKPAVEAAGGRKIKSNCQTYVGVDVP